MNCRVHHCKWRNFKKTPAVYVGPDSCHDPSVRGAIVKGVGQRLRINSSKTEFFEESVEDTAKSFKISGYNYQNTKKELLKFKEEDPVQLIRKEKVSRNKPEKGVKVFYITKYDPRLPHPRQLLSRNYHHLENHPVLSNLFPRENMVGGTRRLPNLSEILSPKLQLSVSDTDRQEEGGGNDGDDGARGAVAAGGGGGVIPTTACCRGIRGGMMCTQIWQKHHKLNPRILVKNVQSMEVKLS